MTQSKTFSQPHRIELVSSVKSQGPTAKILKNFYTTLVIVRVSMRICLGIVAAVCPILPYL